MKPSINRSLPFSDDAEKGILSCLLQNPAELLDDARKALPLQTFYHPANRLVYQVLLEFHNLNKPIDVVTLSQHFIAHETIDKIGGNAALSELYAFVPTSQHYPYYKGILHRDYQRRRLIQVCTETIQRCHEPCEDDTQALELLDQAEAEVLAIRPQDSARSDDGGLYALQAFDALEARMRGENCSGMQTGFSWLDRLTGGMREELWYVAARPSVGKSALLVQFLAKAISDNVPVGAFSLEMPAQMFMERLIAVLSQVPFALIKSGQVSRRDDLRRVTNAIAQIQRSKFRLEVGTSLSHSEVRSQARRWKRNYGVQMVGLDYLQRMAPPKHKGDRGRAEEHAENSTALANASKELGIPWIVLAQLNRDSDKLKRRPRLSDIEWCGKAEQDADVALLLSEVIPKKGEAFDTRASTRQVVWEIAKQRSGPTGEAIHIFDRPSAAFRLHPVISEGV